MSELRKSEVFKQKASVSASPLVDFSGAVYVKATEKVDVSCKKHGTAFTMSPRKILLGQNGCPDCSGKNRTTDDFIRQSQRVHGESAFDYSKAVYRGMIKHITLICVDHNKEFSQRAQSHLEGKLGCPDCNGQEKITVSRFIERSRKVFGEGAFDFSLLPESFKSIHDKVFLRCLKHEEEFEQSAWSHLNGKHACPGCNPYSAINKERLMRKAREVFPEKQYDYSHCDVSLGVKEHVEIICPVEGHGAFYQTLDNHLSGREGCRKCISFVSRSEKEVRDFITASLADDVEVKGSDRTLIKPYELDIYIPSKNTAIEFNGIYWHTESKVRGKEYHYDKWKMCRDKGVQLITIWEDDWRDSPDLIKRMLAHKLGVSGESKTYARKSTISIASKADAVRFYEDHHIQGYKAGEHIGLRGAADGTLVALSTWKQQGRTVFLERFATSRTVPGGFSKILSYAKQEFSTRGFEKIVTFADHCVSDGGLYEGHGFNKVEEVPPDYMYVVGNTRHHKFGFRKKKFKNDAHLKYLEGMTEGQLAELNGIPKIWDCGKSKYSLDLTKTDDTLH